MTYQRKLRQRVEDGGAGNPNLPTLQPKWELIAQLGDASPLDYGGYFVYRDTTGNYPEEAEYLEVEESGIEKWNFTYTIYRIVLERCMFHNGVLSDNPYHLDHPVWFADDCDEELAKSFCSADPLDRAHAYREIADHHGWINFDGDPLTSLTRKEVRKRYGSHC